MLHFAPHLEQLASPGRDAHRMPDLEQSVVGDHLRHRPAVLRRCTAPDALGDGVLEDVGRTCGLGRRCRAAFLPPNLASTAHFIEVACTADTIRQYQGCE
jgi:hypothetical protein